MRRDNSRLVLAVLLAAGIALLALDSRGIADPVPDTARSLGAALFAPVSTGVSAAAAPVAGVYSALAAAPGAAERISELEAENAELEQRLRARDYDSERAEQLANLLHLSDLGGYEVVPAHAVTRVSARGHAEAITLDAGTSDGVDVDMTVVHADGLVGRVTQASANRATVLLAADTTSAVGARLEDSAEAGVVRGRARTLSDANLLRFELLDATAAVSEGDRIVTLGSHDGAPFVPGVPIGTVQRVEDTPGALSRTAEVRPAVDLSRIDIVGVVVGGPDEDPGDSMLPVDEGGTEA